MNLDWTILHWIQDTLVCPALDFLMPKITLLGNGGAIGLLVCAVGGRVITTLTEKGSISDGR